ncbi:MAG: tRNA (guanine(37)-N(1))-methyltransferase [uncultured Acidimicrobiales bacterium]|uniref:tRNA (guanine-N(1)-)-methyltransferase n=1 Tax=uncultured Acidimicrobiales bacterium TaxID=310071 RepID=A0A6J4IP00_9ACTN|nr:MAG: tRNA (guanine(37)-N(1))-methyltransferase [uncultured Acidimicrobiales bacterium]
MFTIFPDLVDGFCWFSLLGRARLSGAVEVRVHDLRSLATDPHRSVDDTPYGGGAGMVLRPEPVFEAVEAAEPPRPLLLLGPAGVRLDQRVAEHLASGPGFSLLCGRYEGVDARVAEHLCDGELSIGDYVLGGGEVAACVVVEAVTRLLPGVMGNAESGDDESFGAAGLLEHPQYTRPVSYRGHEVPAVLLSGDHARTARWRQAQSVLRTAERRPDLLEARGGLTGDDREILAEHGLLDRVERALEGSA